MSEIDGVQITETTVRIAIESRSKQLFMATDVAYWFGFRQVDSNHPAYRPCLRALNKLYERGLIGKYYVPEANISVFYRIP